MHRALDAIPIRPTLVNAFAVTKRNRSITAHRARKIAVILLATIPYLHNTAGFAAPPAGTALIIGDGAYAGRSDLPACTRTAHAVATRLQHLGFTVDQAIDGSAGVVRDAINSFAEHVAAAPPGRTIAYVCAEAVSLNQRLFLLPSDVDLQQTVRPQTQGVVIQALLNAMSGTNGTLVAELGVASASAVVPAVAALQHALPQQLHLVMTAGDGKQVGTIGAVLASDATDPADGWDRLATTLQAGSPAPSPAIVIYEPTPVAPPASPPAAAEPTNQAAANGPPPPATVPPQGPPPATQAVTPDAAPSAASPPPPTAPLVEDRSVPVAPTAPAETSSAIPSHPPATKASPPHPPASQPKASRSRSKPASIANERTRRLQIALARHGFYTGPLNGVADGTTEGAIRAYQASLGDPASGRLSPTEIVHLLDNE